MQALSPHLRVPSPHAEADLWLPPRRMRRYQLAKLGGAAVVSLIFTGWLVLQWSSPVMRVVAGSLLLLTLWITFRSIVVDAARARGRQLRLDNQRLTITRPDGSTVVPVADIASATWDEETTATMGLWLYNAQGQPLAHLDSDFLADQAEARAFLSWARRHANLNFPVRWPGP